MRFSEHHDKLLPSDDNKYDYDFDDNDNFDGKCNDIANENDSEDDDDECDDNDDGDLLSSFSPRLLLLLEVNKEKLLVYFMYIRLYFV